MFHDRWKFHCSGALAIALFAASCSAPPESNDPNSDPAASPEAEGDNAVPADQVEEVSQPLTSAEQTQLNNLKKDMSYYKPSFKVKPILNCIDKISTTKFIAHFGYSNSASSTRTIPLGPLNRFFPSPANRGQPTVFAKGTWSKQVQVPFNGSLLLWGLDGNVAAATKFSSVCSKPPPKCPVTCDDKNPCTADLCSASTGFRCVHKPLGNGTSCADANACNGDEVCKEGQCKPGKPPVCQDNNPCTANTCEPTRGCVFVPKADGTSCPVSGNCGAGGACKSGQCTPNSPSCDDNNPCTADACGSAPSCSMAITQNVYTGSQWWGTITFRNNGPAAATAYKVELDVPANAHCTNDALPAGAVLSPLSGSGPSAKTISNHCIFTWASPPALAVGASKTFNYSADTQAFSSASNVQAGCIGTGCTHTPVPVGTACGDGNFCNGDEVCDATSQCKAPSRPDCNDNNPCTVDSCQTAGGCGHVPGNNGLECTTSSGGDGKCEEGICQPTGTSCNDDGNACTDEVIDPITGACTHPPKVDDTPCNDNNLCTQTDLCKSGTCTGTAPKVCGGATACRTGGTCNPGTGLCSGGQPINEGGGCDDNNLCTSTDRCAAGQCVGVAVVCAGDQCHNAGTCDANTGLCFNPNKPNGTACSDGVRCTSADVCTDGTCGGEAVVCQAQDGCHEPGVCDEGSGVCSNPVSPSGKACNDSNACTQSDACMTGVCEGTNQVTCPGATACLNAGVCDPGSGMCLIGTPKPDGTTCDDTRRCTTGDACRAGVCGGAPLVCTPSDGCHEAGVCDEGTGLCSNPASPDGKTCSDGVNCTSNDRCTAGVCGGAAVVCPEPTNACKVRGTCQESTGQCTTPNAPDGTACNDANACTRTDTCASGACTGGNPVVCQAGDQCLEAGVCNPGTGVCSSRAPKPPGTTCSDGVRCTSGDVCNAGQCAGTPVTCAGGLVCRESSGTCESLNACDACEQAHIISGECDARIGCANITTGAADVALCVALRDCMLTTRCWANDPMDCLCGTATGTDCLSAASNGACKAQVMAAVKSTDPAEAPTLFYDFGVPAGFATQQIGCDRDFCSAASTPPSTACPLDVCPDDGNPCTGELVVNGVCTHPPAANGTACNDGNACTQSDACMTGVCEGTSPVQCSGASGCKEAGTCDPTSGLCLGGSNKPNGTACSDGLNCTSGDVCTGGVCGGSPVVCPTPTDACKVAGTCVEATGACSAPTDAPNGTTCNDSRNCTTADACTAGVCAGTPKECPGGQNCDEANGMCKQDACGQCLQDAVANGLCDAQIGCAQVTTGAADAALCVSLHGCMLGNHCATSDPFDCFCGSAVGTACLTAANGICRDQTLAAAKTTSFTDAGTRFYDFAFPVGNATQEIACRRDFCPGVCPL